MHHIKLIFTRHEECGFCNSKELYGIIKNVKPDIIFEELSDYNFRRAYDLKTLNTLETDAVKQYLVDHPVKHLAVDNYPIPDYYDSDLELMYNRLTNENRDFRNLIHNKISDLSFGGFRNLNSEKNNYLFELIHQHKNIILDVINDENLFRIQRLEKEITHLREFEIVSNIYNYSYNNSYKQAILLMGSGHRKSMLNLIADFEKREKLKLRWTYYNNGSQLNNLLTHAKSASKLIKNK
jgi:hypothetical protein